MVLQTQVLPLSMKPSWQIRQVGSLLPQSRQPEGQTMQDVTLS